MKLCVLFHFKLLVWLFLYEKILANVRNFTNTTSTGNSLSSDKDELNTSTDRPNNTKLSTKESYENMSTSLEHSSSNATAAYNDTVENSTDNTNLVATSSSPVGPNLHHTSKNTHLMRDMKRNQLCGCDLTFGSCDVNCCCDLDCSSEDNLTFDQCVRTNLPSSPNLNYCIQMSLIYKNNGPYEVRTTSNNLFCIVQDNDEQQYEYRPLSATLTMDDLKSIATKNHFSWGDPKEDLRRWIPKEMKVGSELYIMDQEHQTQVWRFPISLFSAECQARQNVTYLIDQKASCSLAIDLTAPPCSHKSLNASSHYGFYLLRNPALLNESVGIQKEMCHEKLTCILATPAENHTCLDDNDVPGVCSLLDGNLPSVTFEEGSSVCHNVVTKVTYQIAHNGTSGLISAKVLFQLETIDARAQYVNQVFETVYLWNKTLNSSFVRSGNPGYIVGRPILAGRKKVINSSNEQIDVIEMSKDVTIWLTIVKAHHNGFCTEFPENRAPVNFGENLMSACILKFEPQNIQSCDNIQKTILTIINGSLQPDSIGSFGNSNNHNVSDWIPIQFANSPNVKHSDKYLCKSVITDLHIDIYHAATGTISEPQQKIIAIVFQYQGHHDIHLNCTDDLTDLCKKEIILTSSVNFKDISQPAMQLFGQPPSLHVSVPGDFFYPFMFASQAQVVGDAFLLLLHMLCVITF